MQGQNLNGRFSCILRPGWVESWAETEWPQEGELITLEK
jgi:hypothetical protein